MMMVIVVMVTNFIPITTAGITFTMRALLKFSKAVVEHGARFAFAAVAEAVEFTVTRQRSVTLKACHDLSNRFDVILKERQNRLRRKAVPKPLALEPITDLQDVLSDNHSVKSSRFLFLAHPLTSNYPVAWVSEKERTGKSMSAFFSAIFTPVV